MTMPERHRESVIHSRQRCTIYGPTRSRSTRVCPIVRVFVRLRHIIAVNVDVARRINALEAEMKQHAAGNEQKFHMVFEVLRQLMAEDDASDPPAPIGFQVQDGQ